MSSSQGVELDGLNLAQLADALVGVESTDLLLNRIETVLQRVNALPARLWLMDVGEMVFYCVAGFGCPREVEDLPAEDILMDPQLGHYVLHQNGDPIGMLQIIDQSMECPTIDLMVLLLGPVLIGVNNHEQTLRELRHMHLQSDRLIAAGHLLQHLDVEVLLTEIMQCVLETVDADVGAILVADEDGTVQENVSWGLTAEHIDGLRTRSGERLVDAVLETGQSLRLRGRKLREEVRCEIEGVLLTGLLAIPLISSNRKHGIVILANPQEAFTKDHERLLTVVCDMATIALDNLRLVASHVANERLRRDLEVAQTVQSRMLPDTAPDLPHLEVAGLSEPSEETGGDYYTWMERDGSLVAMIGDVTGHGLGAALFTTAAHAMVQYQFRNSRNIEHALKALNQGLYYMRSGRFMTSAALEINVESLEFTFASAGHNPLCWVHNNEIKWLDSTGTPLGILNSNTVTESDSMKLSVGDLILLYTDGITEAFNPEGEWWGEEAMAESVMAAHKSGLTGQEVIDHLLNDMRVYSQGVPAGDDVTLVAISIT